MKNSLIVHYLISVFISLLFPQLFTDLEESIFDLKTYFDFKGKVPLFTFFQLFLNPCRN